MLSLPSVPQRDPETFLYSNEVPALAHTCALIVSMLPLRSTSCWNHAPPVTYSFIPDPGELRLHPAWLTSPRVCFWVEGEISTLHSEQEAIYPFYQVLAEILYAQGGHCPLPVAPALIFFSGLHFSECEHDLGLNQSLHHDMGHAIYTVLCSRVSFHFKQFALFQV